MPSLPRTLSAVTMFPALVLPDAGLQAVSLPLRSGPATVGLFELYTSGGCSSRPPPERWLGGLERSPYPWRRIVPVALHVDYCDHLGRRDGCDSPLHGLRQRA